MRRLMVFSISAFVMMFVFAFWFYSEIPAWIPLIPGVSVEKNHFWTMRVQLINALSFAAICLVGNSMVRYREFTGSRAALTALVATIIVKSLFELVGLFQPDWYNRSSYLLILLIVAGLGTAAFHSAFVFQERRWRNLRFTSPEKVALAVMGAAYLGVNVPVMQVLFAN